MNSSVQIISSSGLMLAFLPVVVVLIILYKWSLQPGNAIYAVLRMLIQLLLVGYVLSTILQADSSWLVASVMMVMVVAASWIALGTVKQHRLALYRHAFWAIITGGGLTLILVTQGVIALEPWFEPQYMIPLAGMIFANSMNSVSLAAERLQAELQRNIPYERAKMIAFNAAFYSCY